MSLWVGPLPLVNPWLQGRVHVKDGGQNHGRHMSDHATLGPLT